MRKIKRWFFERFLPEYCRRKLLEDLDKLQKENNDMQKKYDNLASYVKGIERTLCAQRRMTIYNNIGRDK